MFDKPRQYPRRNVYVVRPVSEEAPETPIAPEVVRVRPLDRPAANTSETLKVKPKRKG